MKFSTTFLFSTVASASLWARSIDTVYKRDEAAPQATTISRDPLPDQSGLATVLNALQTIKDLTVGQGETIGNFTGASLDSALEINTATTTLNDATYNGSVACSKIDPLSVGDAETLGSFTQGLAYAVNATIAKLISKKPAFEKLGIASVVVGTLQGTAQVSYVFSATVAQKVPAELQIISAALSSQIGQSISMGIECFNGTNTSCITTIANPDRTLQQAIANDTINGGSAVRAGGFTALIVAIFVAVLAF